MEDEKPIKPEVKRINTSVENQNSNTAPVMFKLKTDTPLKKLIDEYHRVQNSEPSTFKILTEEGIRLMPQSTPQSLELQDNEVVTAMLFQEASGL